MTVVNYATLQQIRQQAGFQYTVKAETPTGAVDGANKVFTAFNNPFVDNTGDDLITVADVIVYDNGSVVNPANYTINAATGQVTFTTAPTSGHVVTLTYTWSPIADVDVTTARTNARSLMDGYIGQVYSMPIPSPSNVPLLAQINQELAAAALLIQSYGVSGINTSSDGYALRKVNTALLVSLAAQTAELLDINGLPVSKNSSVTPDASNVFPTSSGINEKGELFTTGDENFALQDPARTANPRNSSFNQNFQGN